MALDQSQNRKGWIGKPGLFLLKIALLLVLSCAVAVAYLVIRSHDPVYVLRELKDWTDYRRFDPLIVKVAREYDLDPRLIKAVVWRESRFQADMTGRNGERGGLSTFCRTRHSSARTSRPASHAPRAARQVAVPDDAHSLWITLWRTCPSTG